MEYETLKDYLVMAKKIISRLAPKFYPSLAKEMLISDDAISMVATAIMTADWKWNPEYRSKTNTVRTQRAYRNQRAIWAIQKWLSEKKKKKYTLSLSYEYKTGSSEHSTLTGILADKKAYDPSDLIANKDEVQNNKKIIDELLNSSLINNKQRAYITEYYLEDKTLQETGDKYGVTKEAVRQGIMNGISTIRKFM